MTLYFQVQFPKLKCTENTKNTTDSTQKSETKRNKIIAGKNHHQGPKKMPRAQDPELQRQYQKRNIPENLEQGKDYEKNQYQKNPKSKQNMKKEIRGSKVERFCQQIRHSPYFV